MLPEQRREKKRVLWRSLFAFFEDFVAAESADEFEA